MRFGFRKCGIQMLVVLAAMVLTSAAHAQTTTTTQTKSFEILSVDGNVLIIREPEGTRELIVPSDFLFTVDGKSLAVSDLKPGMKGTAKVTKTTISYPVTVTQVKNVTVVKTMGGSVIVQGDDGFKMFSQGELDKQGVHVFMDGKPVKLEDLREGDRLTASIVTAGPPQKLSKTEVDVTLAKAAAATAAPKVATKSTSSEPGPAVETPAADTIAEAAADTSATPAADTTAAPASRPSSLLWLGVIFIILVAVLLIRRRSKR
jgi:hypothetical protein